MPESLNASSKRPSESHEISVSNKRAKLPMSVYRTRVLDEDDYTEALARIIRRDFFPQLDAQCKAQEESDRRQALQTFADVDPSRMDWATARTYRAAQAATPFYSGQTPSSSRARPLLPQDVDKPYDESLSLTAFLSQYTSEDNASFAEILQRQNAQRKQDYAWAFDSSEKTNLIEARNREARQKLIECVQRAVQQSETGKVMLIEGVEPGRPGERLVLEHGVTHILGDKESVKNAKQRFISAAETSIAQGSNLLEGPKQQLLISDGKPEAKQAVAEAAGSETTAEAEKPTQMRAPGKDIGLVEGWKHTARNAFMFPPDANRSLTSLGPSGPKRDVDDYSAQGPKGISHRNTRIASATRLDDAPSPTRSNIAAAIAGTPYPGRNPASPRVNGYGFVDVMPSPSPDKIGKAGLRQLMTYGKLAATPVALRAFDQEIEATEDKNDPAARARKQRETDAREAGTFRIPATPRRDEIAHEMAKKASKSLSRRHGVRIPTLQSAMQNQALAALTPKSSSVFSSTTPTAAERKLGLSPAAKTLLTRTGPRAAGIIPRSSSRLSEGEATKARQREKLVQERLRKATWDASEKAEQAN